jgi:hypothetical protein
LISDFYDAGYDKILKIVGKKHDLVGVVLSDEREKSVPSVGLMKMVDPESGKTLTIDTSDKGFKKWFAKQRETYNSTRKTLFVSSHLDNVDVNTRESYIKPLVNFFKMREKRW